MTTTPADLIELVRAAVAGRTDCRDRIYTARTWSSRSEEMPLGLIRYARNDRTALGKGDIQFTAVDTVQIVLQTAAVPGFADDAALLAAEAEAWRIQRQLEAAIIADPDLWRQIELIPFIRTVIDRSSDGQLTFVGVKTELGLQYYQGPEDFGLPYEGAEVSQPEWPTLDEVRIDARQGGLDAGNPDAGPLANIITRPPEPST